MSNDPPPWLGTISTFVAVKANQEEVITMCSLLANRRRQLVILYLLNRDPDEWISMEEIARWVTAVRYEYSLEEAKGADYRNIRESLRHTHLRTLADAGVIKYDAQQTRVTPDARLPEVGRVFLHLLLLSSDVDGMMS
ncbi:hypothetical protein CP556_22000 [Natrinema sp. CBA1119]|uniref:DUF7344 domain-containing protein n=1 Tax=Natrinema sp. CBA1119 TaxID=1608465 RepID=UPI000BF437D4|nr:hypothetical protein [Natrinema sp. CBA1119]PGF14367.1 hypothetical protein CP556_22000 [Natrinema sp. CBA1119]